MATGPAIADEVLAGWSRGRADRSRWHDRIVLSLIAAVQLVWLVAICAASYYVLFS
jgi:hypothetical protein